VQETLQENYETAIMRVTKQLDPFFVQVYLPQQKWREDENLKSNLRDFRARAVVEHYYLW
jgi:hypothetical protein